jgi:hypothetical protein
VCVCVCVCIYAFLGLITPRMGCHAQHCLCALYPFHMFLPAILLSYVEAAPGPSQHHTL